MHSCAIFNYYYYFFLKQERHMLGFHPLAGIKKTYQSEIILIIQQ